MSPISFDGLWLRERPEISFVRSLIDALPQHVAILDAEGTILAVNRAWLAFARRNGATEESRIGTGRNYLEVCREAAGLGSAEAGAVLAGLLALIDGSRQLLELDYRCDSPALNRWFTLTAMPISSAGFEGVVVSHALSTADHQARAQLAAGPGEASQLMMCSGCKKVRTADSPWQPIEAYLDERHGERFSHSICPECAERLYPDGED